MQKYFLNVHGHMISGFSVDGCLKSAVLVFIYQFVKNYIMLCEILCSNLIFLCLLFKFSEDNSSSSLVSVHIMNIPSIYRKYSIDLFLIYGFICCLSNCAMKIFVFAGARIVDICTSNYL